MALDNTMIQSSIDERNKCKQEGFERNVGYAIDKIANLQRDKARQMADYDLSIAKAKTELRELEAPEPVKLEDIV